MPDRVICDLCNRPLEKHESYAVRMDIFADPSTPALFTEDLEDAGFDEKLDSLLDEMKNMTVEELQDGVHRRFEFRLCGSCHRQFLANPLGKPRQTRAGDN